MMRMTVKPFRYKNFQKSFHIYNYIDALEFLHLPYGKPSPFRRKSLRMRNLPVLPPTLPSETDRFRRRLQAVSFKYVEQKYMGLWCRFPRPS